MSGLVAALIAIVLVLIIMGVAWWWTVREDLPPIPLPDPFRRIVYALMAILLVLAVIWIALALLGIAGAPVPKMFRL